MSEVLKFFATVQQSWVGIDLGNAVGQEEDVDGFCTFFYLTTWKPIPAFEILLVGAASRYPMWYTCRFAPYGRSVCFMLVRDGSDFLCLASKIVLVILPGEYYKHMLMLMSKWVDLPQ